MRVDLLGCARILVALGLPAAGCGRLADADYRVEPLAVVNGLLRRTAPAALPPGDVSFAIWWYPAASLHGLLDRRSGLIPTAVLAPGEDARAVSCEPLTAYAPPACDGTPASERVRCLMRRDAGVLAPVDYEARFTDVAFGVPIYDLPPHEARYDLSRQGGAGVFAIGTLRMFVDDGDGVFRNGAPERAPEYGLADSASPGPTAGGLSRSFYIAFLDGRIEAESAQPSVAGLLSFLPQAFSQWVKVESLDGYGRVTAVAHSWQPIDGTMELVLWDGIPSAPLWCEEFVELTEYLGAIPDGEAPLWCRDDARVATWARSLPVQGEPCTFVTQRYSGDFSCATDPAPSWSCPPPTTGSVRVTATTAGADVDADGYEASAGGEVRPLGPNGSATFAGLVPGSHAVALGGLAQNCMVSGANPVPVSVSAGAVSDVAFAVECVARAPEGSLRVTTTTLGEQQDPDGYTMSVDGGSGMALAPNGTALVAGLTPGDHALALAGVAHNCAVEANPLVATVIAGAVASAAFQVACLATTRVVVTTATTGADPDPDGYVAEVGGLGQRRVGHDDSVLFDLGPGAAGLGEVMLSDVAPNCTGGGHRAVWLEAGQLSEVAYAIECGPSGTRTELGAFTSGGDQGRGRTW